MHYDTIVRNVQLFDGSGADPVRADVGIADARISAVGDLSHAGAARVIEGNGRALAPGFIDAHTHDDTNVIRTPAMLPKISQGITTVVVGNCGISAAPVTLSNEPPDPMGLLGETDAFRYPTFADYVAALETARPAVNVAALIGHTALRSNHMDRFDRPATAAEIVAMRVQLADALEHGALGLSTGLAYINAISATTAEVAELAAELDGRSALYTTHLRSETDGIMDALDEAFVIAERARSSVIVSHLKCAGVGNWGRSASVIDRVETAAAAARHPVGCDCYPYTASSSTIDVRQCSGDFPVLVTWSRPHPEMSRRMLADIATEWGVSPPEAAKRLQPGGAIYHCMTDDDVDRILAHPRTMIGSDGLPNDANPHPRLWGTFPRVLGHYSRDRKLFPLAEAIRKMTSLTADCFALRERGRVRERYWADLVLFDPTRVRDRATFLEPVQAAEGIAAVWVNGVLSYADGSATGDRAGRFLARAA